MRPKKVWLFGKSKNIEKINTSIILDLVFNQVKNFHKVEYFLAENNNFYNIIWHIICHINSYSGGWFLWRPWALKMIIININFILLPYHEKNVLEGRSKIFRIFLILTDKNFIKNNNRSFFYDSKQGRINSRDSGISKKNFYRWNP